MSIEIIIPRLGWSMEEANFVGWLKQEGERVKTGEPLFTLESEKATQDIEAIDSGILRIPADTPKPGQIVKVGQVIGRLIAEDEDNRKRASDSADSTASGLRPIGPGADSVRSDSALRNEAISQLAGKPAVSPRARRLAARLGLNFMGLRGSGRTGRIIERDVREAAKGHFPAV